MSRVLRLSRGRISPTITLTADDATVSVNAAGAVAINLAIARSGYTGDVFLAVAGLPAGVTGSFSDSTITDAETSSVLTLSASGGAASATDVAFTITATGTGVSNSVVNGLCTVIASGAYTPVAYEDFTSYANTAALVSAVTNGSSLYSSDDIDGNLVELDTTVTFEGHPTMRYNLPGGGASPPQVTGLFPATLNCWVRVRIRFGPGFTTNADPTNSIPGNSTQSKAYKLLFLAYSSASGRSGIEFTNTDDYVSYLGTTISSTNYGASATPTWVKATRGEWSSGEWFDYIMYQEATPTTARFRWWIKQTNSASAPTLIQDTGTYASPITWPSATKLLLGRNYNRTRLGSESFYMNWGSWEIVDGSIYSDPFGVTP